MIARFPRYQELLDKRGGSEVNEAAIAAAMERYTVQDYVDLQVWFNLAWFDPDFYTNDPELAALVQRGGRNFSEADKELIHAKQVQIIRQVVDIHRELQEDGQIEIITTPYAHPHFAVIVQHPSCPDCFTRLGSAANPPLCLARRYFPPPAASGGQLPSQLRQAA